MEGAIIMEGADLELRSWEIPYKLSKGLSNRYSVYSGGGVING